MQFVLNAILVVWSVLKNLIFVFLAILTITESWMVQIVNAFKMHTVFLGNRNVSFAITLAQLVLEVRAILHAIHVMEMIIGILFKI